MSKQSFNLIPFQTHKVHPDISITGTIGRQGNELHIDFVLKGDLEHLRRTALAPTPTRRHNLWQTTCLELFIAPQGTEGYWEFNLSPSGNWNVYEFNAYRQGMKEELSVALLPFIINQEDMQLHLGLVLDLQHFMRQEQSLRIGVSAVIEDSEGRLSYWALTHKGTKPDFHHPDSFVLFL